MKVKVDKEEYEGLLKRVKELEEDRAADCEHFRWLTESLEQRMENFFKLKCMTVIIKRDKNEIVAEVRKQVMDNLFKEEE